MSLTADPDTPELLVRSCTGAAAAHVLRDVAAGPVGEPDLLLWVGDVAAVGGPLAVVLLELRPPQARLAGLLLPSGPLAAPLQDRLMREAEQASRAAGCTDLHLPAPGGDVRREL